MIIAISGTPGTGKTYLAKKLVKASGSRLKYFDLNKYVKDHKLYVTYDHKAKTYDVDIKIFRGQVMPLLEKYRSQDLNMDKIVNKSFDVKEILNLVTKNKRITGIIVDSHLSQYIENDYCIIVRSDIKDIYKRLKARKYTQAKIEENIQSEIFEICLDEARNLHTKIITVYN
jgi:adenylate kinase